MCEEAEDLAPELRPAVAVFAERKKGSRELREREMSKRCWQIAYVFINRRGFIGISGSLNSMGKCGGEDWKHWRVKRENHQPGNGSFL